MSMRGLFVAVLLALRIGSADATSTPTLTELSDCVGRLQREILRIYPGAQVSIGGGAARQLIEHVYLKAPLVLNDIDVFVVLNDSIDREKAKGLGLALEKAGVGAFDKANIAARTRGKVNSGYSIFFTHNAGKLDVGLHPHAAHLDLNGIFDIDTIRIPLRAGDTVLAVAGDLSRSSYETLLASGRVVDPHNGWQAWTTRRPNLIRLDEIALDPWSNIVRVARTYGRLQAQPTADLVKQLRPLAESRAISDPVRFARHIVRLLEDSTASQELRILSQFGFIKKWSPSLGELIESTPPGKLERWLGRAQRRSSETSLDLGKRRLKSLLAHLPLGEQRRLVTSMISPQWGSTEWLTNWIDEISVYESKRGANCLMPLIRHAY